jgi:putative iron-dependent peroxidase
MIARPAPVAGHDVGAKRSRRRLAATASSRETPASAHTSEPLQQDQLGAMIEAMASPQTGIFALGTASHAWLELDLAASEDPAAAVARVATLREPRTTIGGVNLVAGFRPELWASVAPDAAPPGVTGFDEPVRGPDGFTLPATQHDVVIWLSGAAYDIVFDVARDVLADLAGSAALAGEMVGWPYHRDLDLTGFMDGTENPTLVEATQVALLPTGSHGEGGSVLLLQQWEHDASSWEALGVQGQEAVIGRSKAESRELDPRPESSHVARTDQERFGKIFRRNIPYGSVDRHGTIFVGFAADQGILVRMLESMAGLHGGERDALTRFARPLTGAYYVIPSADRLATFDG